MDSTGPRLPRSTSLTGHLRGADAALARQEGHLAAVRDALGTLRVLRDQCRRDAEESASPDRAEARRRQVDELTHQLTVLAGQLESLEQTDATARAQSVGLRRIEEEAATELPCAAGPVPTDGLPDLGGTDDG